MLCSLLLCLLPLMALAQAPDTLWTRLYGDENQEGATSVLELPGGDFLLAGSATIIGSGGQAIYLIRTDSEGQARWERTYGDGMTADLQPTPDGQFILTGRTVLEGTSSTSAFLFKLTAQGDSLWMRTYFSGFYTGGSAVRSTRDGGYVLAGIRVASSVTLFGDFYVVKTDSGGAVEWTRTCGADSMEEWAFDVVQTADDGFLLAGLVSHGSAGIDEAYVVRMDAAGDTLWTRTLGGAGLEYAVAALETADHGFLVAGNTESFGAGGSDYWLIRFDSAGDTLWTRTYGDAENNWAATLQALPGGGYLLAGTREDGTGHRYELLRLDDNGEVQWQGLCGREHFSDLTDVVATADGGFLMAGWFAPWAQDPTDILLVKTAPALTGNEPPAAVPLALDLEAYPNPFNSTTEIRYALPRSAHATLAVFDVTGREVAVLVDEVARAGAQRVAWDAGTVASGVYFVRLAAGETVLTRKVLLVR